ncbi:hypothetical protein ACVWXQ_006354 [Bradyrhizobium sp. S3.14.4]
MIVTTPVSHDPVAADEARMPSAAPVTMMEWGAMSLLMVTAPLERTNSIPDVPAAGAILVVSELALSVSTRAWLKSAAPIPAD